jgi:hypothetical protein
MIKDLIKELEDEGFKVDDYSGTMDRGPVYVLDLYGHRKQIGQIRLFSQDWFNFRESAHEVISKIKSTSKKIKL